MQLSAESSTVERGILPMLSLPRLLALQPLLLLLFENPCSSLGKEQEKDCPPARQNHVEVRIKGGGVAVEEVVNRGYVRNPETRGQTRGVRGEGGGVPLVLRHRWHLDCLMRFFDPGPREIFKKSRNTWQTPKRSLAEESRGTRAHASVV